MEKKILELIKESKNGGEDSLLELIERFKPLIKKYTKQLYYEDAEHDLIEHFIIIVNKIPSSIEHEAKAVKYIKTSIENEYIKLAKKRNIYCYQIKLIDPTEEEFEGCYKLNTFSICTIQALNTLPIRQKQIVIYRYFYGYSDK